MYGVRGCVWCERVSLDTTRSIGAPLSRPLKLRVVQSAGRRKLISLQWAAIHILWAGVERHDGHVDREGAAWSLFRKLFLEYGAQRRIQLFIVSCR